MDKKRTKLLLVIAGGILFSLIFWQEQLGINVLLFDAFILASLFTTYASARKNPVLKWLLIGHLICLTSLLIHNTDVSKIAFSVTLLLIAGFAEYTHRSAWFAGGSVLLNIIFCSASFTEQLKAKRSSPQKRWRISKLIRFAFFPLLLLIIFFIIYLASNSVFGAIANKIENIIGAFLENLFNVFSPQRLLFLLLGIYITGAILLRSKLNYFSSKEQTMEDQLLRKKIPWKQRLQRPFFQLIELFLGKFSNGIMALRNEYIIGLISFILLNLLLLVVNAIDISYLWFNFDYMGEVYLYKMLHEGTELLILSIVLAMLVVLFFFKGNLNFYKKNKWLKAAAYAWIFQNAILVISVLLRDYYYIARYGLAYKRIGVLFFLAMVLIGLTTVFFKIWKTKTSYYLLRINAWAGIILLVMASTIHWDIFIADYNIKRKNTVPLDTQFLLSLSDKTLPLLDKNQAAFAPITIQSDILAREQAFLRKQQQHSWLSWNYADALTTQYLTSKNNLNLKEK